MFSYLFFKQLPGSILVLTKLEVLKAVLEPYHEKKSRCIEGAE